jgi:predicted dehydrogenase
MRKKASIERRHFLKGGIAGVTALGFPTVIPSSALGKAGAVAPSERVTMGVIGTGGRGAGDMQNFLNDERVRIVAVCDVERSSTRYNRTVIKRFKRLGREPAKAMVEKRYEGKGCDAYGDYRELLGREDIDSVLIATPDHWHALQATAAARAGKHIYCEKPLSLTIAEGRRMVSEIEGAGKVWQTGSQQRSDVHFRLACELVRNGRIGDLKRIRVGLASDNRDNNGHAANIEPTPVPEGLDYETWLGPAPEAPFCKARLHSNWRWFYDYSGGNLTDFGAHHLDIAQWALDAEGSGPVEFYDFKATWAEEGSIYTTPPTFSFSCRYESGVEMKVADRMDFGSGIQFVGSEGTITTGRGALKVDPPSARAKLGPDDLRLYESKDHFRNFIDAITTGVRAAAPIETAHRTITIAHLGNIGLRLGRESLRWDPAAEKILGDAEADAMRSRPMRAPWTLE